MSNEIELLRAEVRYIKDLFERRLLDDKPKSKLIDATILSLQGRDEAEKGLLFGNLFKECLVSLDRLISEEPSEELVLSVREEMLEIFRRRGLEIISSEGTYDARFHEVVGTVEPTVVSLANEIVDVKRDGFTLSGRVLRPASVIIADPKA